MQEGLFTGMVKKGITERLTSEESPEGGEEGIMWTLWEERFL